jgi:hypothetical protein
MDRYRRLRSISTRHHNAALKYLPRMGLPERARQLGLLPRPTLITGSEQELALILDLAVHTSKPGRSRAIERYAKAEAPVAGSDDALVLDALCAAWFSIWRVERRHEVAGLIVKDIASGNETWLMDQGLTGSVPAGYLLASRLCWPAEFAMTCGVAVPVDSALLEDVIDRLAWMRGDNRNGAAADPRFAATIYRAAVEAGAMDNVEFRAPTAGANYAAA